MIQGKFFCILKNAYYIKLEVRKRWNWQVITEGELVTSLQQIGLQASQRCTLQAVIGYSNEKR